MDFLYWTDCTGTGEGLETALLLGFVCLQFLRIGGSFLEGIRDGSGVGVRQFWNLIQIGPLSSLLSSWAVCRANLDSEWAVFCWVSMVVVLEDWFGHWDGILEKVSNHEHQISNHCFWTLAFRSWTDCRDTYERFRDCCLLGFVRLQFFRIGGSFLGGVWYGSGVGASRFLIQTGPQIFIFHTYPCWMVCRASFRC